MRITGDISKVMYREAVIKLFDGLTDSIFKLPKTLVIGIYGVEMYYSLAAKAVLELVFQIVDYAMSFKNIYVRGHLSVQGDHTSARTVVVHTGNGRLCGNYAFNFINEALLGRNSQQRGDSILGGHHARIEDKG